jgi:isocitrate lyase
LGYECSLTEAKKLAKTLDFDFYFDWEATRTYEGFYLIEQNNINFCIRRAREYSNYADLIWMETETPSIAVAR